MKEHDWYFRMELKGIEILRQGCTGEHLARSAPEEDHHSVIAAAMQLPCDWRRPPGRPRSTWLRVIDKDVQSQNFGVHTAWRKAKDRDTWHQVVSTATLLGLRH